MHNEIFERAQERILALGLSEDATKRKLAEYAALRENKPQGLSSLGVANTAEDLMTSFHWLITGERDPFELRSTAQNVLCGPENDEPGSRWVLAKNVFSDISMAYQQVTLGPSDAFQWTEPRNTEYAVEKLRQLGSKSQDMSFFELVEECFGVEIIVLDRPENFTALGGMVCGSPFIVVKQGLDTDVGHDAVVMELGNIMAGNLYWYSDVFEDGANSESWIRDFMWVLDFTSTFMNSTGMDVLMKEGAYTAQRFPKRLVEAHRKAVAEKTNFGYFLEWMEK